jgi:preprotein translocase subunit SecD
VSFLAAAILYYFAAGDVKGFAFTLGLSTILDLVVVFLFTHPLVSLLSRMPSFGTARFTGLDAIRGGPAVPDEAPARAAGRPARSRGSAAARGAAPVAVLDRTEQDAPAAPAVSTGDGGDGGEQTEPSGERRHATPAAGTAAERAAQRRARMRQDRQNKGRS